MTSADPKDVVVRFVDAYNAGDDDAMLGLCSENVHVVHHNRGVEINGRDGFAGLLGGFKAAFPDKQFVNRRGIWSDGDEVHIEHTWTGTAVADVPGFANNGEKAELDLCTHMTIRDGQIVEYHDFG